jgi:outer membrane protein TolC
VLFSALLLPAACAVGPNYQAPPISSASLTAPRLQSKDSVRVFLDSLSAERGGDTNWRAPAELRASDVEWLDILKDSALTNLVTLALRQNPDLANARARIRELLGGWCRARALFPLSG